MTHRASLSLSFTTEAGDEINLEVDASLIPERPAAYGSPAEPEEVEIHAITLTDGTECPAWLDAQIERSDEFATRLHSSLRDDLRAHVEDREPVGFDI